MPLFNNDDKQERDYIKSLFNSIYSCDLQDLGEFHNFDLKDSKNKMVVEIKKINYNYENLPRLMFNYEKYLKAKQYKRRNYRVFFVMIYKNNEIYYNEYNKEEYKKEVFARRDRGYNEEKDYIFIESSKFKNIENVEYDF